MTAEVCLMNANGVALASDSAVTVRRGRRNQKIYNGADKLFQLSEVDPVGVMFYGTARVAEVPWETVIKAYRSEHGWEHRDNVAAHADHFFEYLGKRIDRETQREDFVTRCLPMMLGMLDYLRKFKSEADAGTKRRQERNAYLKKFLEEVARRQKGREDLFRKTALGKKAPSFRSMNSTYGQIVDAQLVRPCLEEFEIDQANMLKAKQVMLRSVLLECGTGIVFAGFGKTDLLPSCAEYEFASVICDHSVRREKRVHQVAFGNGAVIVPFAQDEMVKSFMDGIHPSLEQEIKDLVFRSFTEIAQTVGNQFIVAKGKKKSAQVDKLAKLGVDTYERIWNDVEKFQRSRFVEPVVDIVRSLPKDELAHMAESLVNLTSFRRRVTDAQETVGGPVDVAVITRGDGFVWIKRKHYFDPELNPRILARYTRIVRRQS